MLPGKESGKTWQGAENLLEQFSLSRVDRGHTIVAVGGGALLDLVGFVASVYLRGVDLILEPTTLLSMVDASIGGKNGIDMPFAKNGVGTIYPAKEVWIDLSWLDTLPQEEWVSGLFEVWKVGLVANRDLWSDAVTSPFSREWIPMARETKETIVQQDLLGKNLRHILNFGHTVGHALEKVSQYTLLHGWAVGLGSLVEARLSCSLGLLPREEFEEIEKAYRQFPLRLPRHYDRKSLQDAMYRDKKIYRGDLCFSLISRIGQGVPLTRVSWEDVLPTILWMEDHFS